MSFDGTVGGIIINCGGIVGDSGGSVRTYSTGELDGVTTTEQ